MSDIRIKLILFCLCLQTCSKDYKYIYNLDLYGVKFNTDCDKPLVGFELGRRASDVQVALNGSLKYYGLVGTLAGTNIFLFLALKGRFSKL